MKSNKKNNNIIKKSLKKINVKKTHKKLDCAQVYHETGRIIANPLIYKDYNYFDDL